jgi:hypothetical protein
MGKHNFRKIGNRNVIIGATDDRGNTILNKPMTVGYGARGGPGSIVIGAFAGAGAAPAAKPKDDGGTDVP